MRRASLGFVLLAAVAAACAGTAPGGGRPRDSEGTGGAAARNSGAGGSLGRVNGGAGPGPEAGGSGGAAAGSGGAGGAPPPGSDGGLAPSDARGGDVAGSDGTTGADGQPAACAAGSLLCDPLRPFPSSIRETALFPSAPDLSKHDDRLRSYAPSPELWSDGLHKDRLLLLPQGQRIDNTDAKKWQFPAGTLFVKTFLDDRPAGRHPVETRIVRLTKDAFEPYQFAVYQWNDAGTEAALLNNSGDKRTPVAVTVSGRTWMHTIPSRIDCGDCHEKNGLIASNFIGFDEIRLNNKRTTASARTQLEELAASNVFKAPLPAKPAAITDSNPVLQRIKSWVYGNCVHCHHGVNGPVDLRPDVFVRNTVGQPTDASGVQPPAGWLRVVPRRPERSVLYVQALRAMIPMGLRAMPPVGVTVAEAERVKDIETWINSLP